MKKNLIYISIIVLLSAAVIMLLKKPVKTTGSFDGKILQADSLKIIEITYEQNRNKIKLVKGIGKWQIREQGNFEPDPNITLTLLQFAHNITLKNIISEKPEKYAKFGIDSTGIILTIRKEDNSSISYIIGNDDQERNYSFYRIPGDNRAYLGTLFPRYRITPDVKDWRNKFISQGSLNEINNLTLRSGDDLIEISRSNDIWISKFNGKETIIEKEKIDPVLNKLSSFKSIGFTDSLNLNEIVPDILIKYSMRSSDIELLITKAQNGFTAFRKDMNQAFIIQDSDYTVFEELFKKKL